MVSMNSALLSQFCATALCLDSKMVRADYSQAVVCLDGAGH